MNRGIHATLYVKLTNHTVSMQNHYTEFFAHEKFVDVMPEGSYPETSSVRATNLCRIAIHSGNNDSRAVVILSVIDNLVKGAAGQAIQNMNLMFGLDEEMGLVSPGLIP